MPTNQTFQFNPRDDSSTNLKSSRQQLLPHWAFSAELQLRDNQSAHSNAASSYNPTLPATHLRTHSTLTDRNVRLINLILSQPHDLKACEQRILRTGRKRERGIT